jgi:hypothetical protein
MLHATIALQNSTLLAHMLIGCSVGHLNLHLKPPGVMLTPLMLTTPACLSSVQLSTSVTSMNQQLEVVADSSATAVAELSAKVDGLQGEIGQVKELLLALLARQQQ